VALEHLGSSEHVARGVIASDVNLDDFLGSDLDELKVALGAATVAVLLVDKAGQYLTARVARGLEDEIRQGSRVPVGLGFAGRIASERRAAAIDRVDSTTVVNPVLWRRGVRAMAGAPLIFEEQLLGVVHVGVLSDRAFSHGDLDRLTEHAESIARRVADWRGRIDRAAAEALQESLTPRLPAIAGLDLAARYIPSGQHGVGGDWYDVFTLPNGRVALTIGDVMGHGLGAATIMGRVRSALRAYAIEDDDPASVLQRLDRKLQYFEINQLTTVAYCILDPATGVVELSLAGHLRPALVPASGGATLLDVPVDSPLGVNTDLPRRTSQVQLPANSLLFLFTDGLVERPDRDLDPQLDLLVAALENASGVWAEIACADVMSALVDDTADSVDDASVLAVRWVGDSPATVDHADPAG
jgi:sigma-B regulation protein RsbU (phosphoserine phosphatase)